MDERRITAILMSEVGTAMENFCSVVAERASGRTTDNEYKAASDQLCLALHRHREYIIRGIEPDALAMTANAGMPS
jgi:hypothetical protein